MGSIISHRRLIIGCASVLTLFSITPSLRAATEQQTTTTSDLPVSDLQSSDVSTAASDLPSTGGDVTALNIQQFNSSSLAGPHAGSADNFLFTGSFIYNIPIAVPPGIAGVQPALGLQYNSSAGNGWAGVGWTLSLGAIQRSTKNGVPKYDTSDTFLITLQGASHELTKTPDGGYRLKIEDSYQKLTFDGSQWIVFDKMGTKYYFGQTSTSRISGAQGTFSWALDKVVDRNGNFMTVSYTRLAGESQIYPSEIFYTGNVARATDRRVTFTLALRGDVLTNYNAGFKIATTQRLSQIKTWVNQNGAWVPAAAYDLTYISRANTNRSLLKSVTVTGFQGVASQSKVLAQFDYPVESSGWEDHPEFAPPDDISSGGDTWSVTSGDFVDLNADGRPDFTISYNNGSTGDHKFGWLNFGRAWILDPKWAPPNIQSIGTYFQPHGSQYTDLNGDGRPDFAFANDQYPARSYLNTTTGWVEHPELALPSGLVAGDGAPKGSRLIDVNGDHRDDLIVSHVSSLGVETRLAYINNGAGWTETPAWRLPSGSTNLSITDFRYDAGAQFVDLNGDGRPDFVFALKGSYDRNGHYAVGGGSRTTLINTGTGWRVDPNYTLPDDLGGKIGTNPGTRLVDVNGDGLPDLVVARLTPTENYKKTYLNTGRGWEERPEWQLPGLLMWDDYQTWSSFADINGDSLPDFIFAYTDTNLGLVNEAYLNTGAGWVARPDWRIPNYLGVTGGRNTGSRMIDVNGDQLADFAIAYAGPTFHHTWLSKAAPHGDLISQITNTVRGVIQVSYENSAAYPNTFLPYSMWVVKSITSIDGRSETPDPVTNYVYAGGLFDLDEKEFLGFGNVQSIDSAGNTTYTFFNQRTAGAENALKGTITDVQQYDNTGHLLRTSFTQWSFTQPSPGVYVIHPSMVQNKNWEVSPAQTTEVDFSYDDAPAGPGYGNVTQTINKGDVALSGDERTENVTYALNAAASLIGFPQRTKVLGPSGEILSDTMIFYDGSLTAGVLTKGNATQAQRYLNLPTPQWITANSEYNGFGQLRAAIDPMGNRTETTYDAFGFPSTVKNAKGHVARTTTDPLTGNSLTTTDPNNQTTTFRYDPLGRLTKSIGPLDSDTYPTTSINYHDEVMGDPTRQFTERNIRQVRGTSSVLWSRDYFDGLGRSYKTENQDAGGNSTIVETSFNNRGLVDRVSYPRFTTPATSAVWTQTTYDALGRPTQVIRPDNSMTTTSYSGRTTTVQDANGKIHSSTVDSYGRIIARQEPSVAASTSYQYDSSGNLIRVTDSKGKGTTFTYDTLGRKLSMTDPNAGTWSYTYDNNGNLTSQTDARGVKIGFVYDSLNRLSRKFLAADPTASTGQTVNTDLSSYIYDSTGTVYSLGRLCSTQFGSGAGGSSFTYDQLGQLTREVQTISGLAYEIQRTYDALGRLTQIKYPNDQSVKYAYDDGNHVATVTNTDGTVTHASFSSYDAFGRALQLTQANGLTKTTFTFDPLKQTLATLKTTGWSASAPVTLQSFSYAFDNVGNLQSVTDAVHPERNQVLSYDDLYRLTRAQGAYGDVSYTYDTLGNFITKEGAVYKYTDAQHPDAVTDVGSGGSAGNDSSTLLAWNLEPSEPIYQVSGSVTLAGSPRASMPLTLSGAFEETILTSGSGAFQFRGVPGGPGALYSVAGSSMGFRWSPGGFSYNPLSQNDTSTNFTLTTDTSSIDVTKLRIPRTALANGSPSPAKSGGAYQAGLIVGYGYGGLTQSGVISTSTLSNLSGYKVSGEGNDVVSHAFSPMIAPPSAAVTGVVGPAFVAGKFQQALSFNGSSDVFAFPNSQLISPTAFTLMLWAKPSAYPTVGSFATLLAKSTGSALGKLTTGFRMGMDGSGKVVAEIGRGGPTASVTSSLGLPLNSWSFVCATYDGVTLQVFVNGQAAGALAVSGVPVANAYAATIGASLSSERRIVNGTQFSGVLDEPRIQGRAWSSAEIGVTMNAFTTATYTYDAAGNRLTKSSNGSTCAYRYDAEGRLTQIKRDGTVIATYVYNENGERVKKVVGSTSTATTVYIGKLFEKRPDGSLVSHIYAGGNLLCDQTQTGTTFQTVYYHSDHLGSVTLVTSPQGQKIQEISYKPFGKTDTLSGSSSNRMKYTSQEEDPESDLYFYNARYYDPTIGKFISADSIVPSAMDPQSFNRYAYCRNNPVALTDPDGHFFWVPIIVGAAIGAYTAGKATNWEPEYVLRGALVGAVGGAVGAGIGNYAMGITGSALLSGVVGGAAGGAASGYAGGAMFGGNRGIAIEQGALWGGIGGGLSQGMIMQGVPDAFAQTGSAYLAGYWQNGSKAAKSGAAYSFVGQLLGNSLTLAGVDGHRVPKKGTQEWEDIHRTNDTFVVTPAKTIKNGEWFWMFVALMTNGTEHTWHAQDSYSPADETEKPRYYRRVTRNVAYTHDTPSLPEGYNFWNNNCTTRFGYLSPASYYANYNYVGPSVYWSDYDR